MRDIVIIHENDEWLVPLREELRQRGVTANEWFLDSGPVPLRRPQLTLCSTTA